MTFQSVDLVHLDSYQELSSIQMMTWYIRGGEGYAIICHRFCVNPTGGPGSPNSAGGLAHAGLTGPDANRRNGQKSLIARKKAVRRVWTAATTTSCTTDELNVLELQPNKC